jgi:hypothetical protein
MKKMVMISILMCLNVVLAKSPVKNPINWGVPGYGGSGCQSDSVDPTIDIKMLQNRFSVEFKDFKLQLDGAQSIDRKNCSIRIPVKIQPGYKLVLSLISPNADIFENRDYVVKSEVEVGFVGLKGIQFMSQNAPGKIGPLSYLNKGAKFVDSPCGSEVMLELNTSVTGLTSLKSSNSVLGVLVKNLGMQLEIRKCK